MSVPMPPDFAAMLAADEADPFLSLRRGGTEVYLVRHADALPDADEVAMGGYDDQGLSALGRRQAKALAERLRAVPLAAVYSSPLRRAQQTAAPLAQDHDMLVRVDGALREVELGPVGPSALPGATAEEQSAALREQLKAIAIVAIGGGRWSAIPGSEPSEQLRARVEAAITRIAAAHAGSRVAIVSHGGAINAFIASVLHIERDYFFPVANTAISVVRLRGQQRLLMGLNDIAHLYTAGLMRLLP